MSPYFASVHIPLLQILALPPENYQVSIRNSKYYENNIAILCYQLPLSVCHHGRPQRKDMGNQKSDRTIFMSRKLYKLILHIAVNQIILF